MRIEDWLRALACKNGGAFGGASEDVKRNRLGRQHEGAYHQRNMVACSKERCKTGGPSVTCSRKEQC